MTTTVIDTRLAELESVIERGVRTFIEVGTALMEIRDERLYRADHETFEDYCQERWGWTASRSRQLIAASEVAQIAGSVTTVTLPNERQARELVPLLRESPEQVAEAWDAAVAVSEGHPTAAVVHEIVRDRLAGLMTSTTGEHYTPAHVVERVVRALGSIDLDPCSNPGAPNVPASSHFRTEDDGLEQGWQGRVYMNPPYGDVIGKWIDKLALELDAGNVSEAIALLPARTDTRWFARLPARVLCFIGGRLRFSDAEQGAPFPSVAAYMGATPERFVAAFSDVGLLYRRMDA